jgi:hypothetical protein
MIQPPRDSLSSRRSYLDRVRGIPPSPERVEWNELGPEFLRVWGFPKGKWEPEHLEILGPTGSGKSYFEATILKDRARMRGSHIVVIATKPADATISALGWPVVTKWPPNQWRKETAQVVYWARATGGPDERGIQSQRAAVNELLHKLWRPESNIIVAFDEIAYVEQELGLKAIVTRYFREGRSIGITIVASTQRPQNVSRYMHSESSWAVFFAPKDEDDAERMAQVAGNKKYYTPILLDLDRAEKEFLLIHTVTRQAYISRITDAPITTPTRRSEHAGKPDSTV